MLRLCDRPRAWPFAAARPEKGVALLLGLITLLLTTPVCGADSRPNIVIILSDDMGYADIGAQGCRDIPTPHIDRQRNATKPFFLYLAFNAVHAPLEATGRYLDRFPAITDRNRRIYAAMLGAMDDGIGRVLEALERIGQKDRTLVIFHNDNGGPTTRNAVNGSRNTPLRGSKCETFEGGIRVPMILRWPGVLEPGTVYRQPAISFDLTATAIAAAGADASQIDGVDLIPFLNGNRPGAPHDTLFWRSRTMSDNYGMRQGNWKFVHSTEGSDKPGPRQKPARDMLFDLAGDPGEQNDLARERPETLADLKRRYEAWSAEVDADCRRLGIDPMMAGAAIPASPAVRPTPGAR